MTKAHQYPKRIVSVETGAWRHECRIEHPDVPQRYSLKDVQIDERDSKVRKHEIDALSR
jgi:hypothetical protein